MLYPIIAVLALGSVGGGVETVGEALDAQAYPMPGQLIDVGDHSLHLSCTGSGSPTVVLEPGSGEMSSNLGWIVPGIATKTRVCVYDRAGRGWSEPATTAQDGEQIATDLHTLLQRANVPGPYVLAGHSFGGLYVLAFAARYPDEVAGMVLVDSTAPKPPTGEATAPDATSADPDRQGDGTALDPGTGRCGPPVRAGRLRQPAAAVTRRGRVPASRPPPAFAAASTSSCRRTPRWCRPVP